MKSIRDLPNFTFDRAEHARLALDTPVAPPDDMSHRLNLHPGTCVKMRTTVGTSPWICGVVHKNAATIRDNVTSTECIIVGHGWTDADEECFVWRGPYSQLQLLWQID